MQAFKHGFISTITCFIGCWYDHLTDKRKYDWHHSNSIMNNNNFNLNGWDNNDKSQEFPQKIASRMDIMFQEPHVEVEKEEEAMLSMRNRQPYQHNLFQRNSFHRKRTRRPRSAGMKRSSRNLRRNSRPKSASLRRRRKK